MSNVTGGRRDVHSRLSAVAEHPRPTVSVAGSVTGDVPSDTGNRLLSLSDIQKPESSVLSGRKTSTGGGGGPLSRKNSNSSCGNHSHDLDTDFAWILHGFCMDMNEYF